MQTHASSSLAGLDVMWNLPQCFQPRGPLNLRMSHFVIHGDNSSRVVECPRRFVDEGL